MAEGGMKLAVLDPAGNVIHQWDDARLAQEVMSRTMAQNVARFRPFLRRKLEGALKESVHAFLIEVARK